MTISTFKIMSVRVQERLGLDNQPQSDCSERRDSEISSVTASGSAEEKRGELYAAATTIQRNVKRYLQRKKYLDSELSDMSLITCSFSVLSFSSKLK